jgi:hypothetical protein
MREHLRLALDQSVRTIDQDGHLHVSMANISKVAVNPYRGNEIPHYQELGLDPDKVYQLFRAPDELAKAAPSFSSKPLFSIHRPSTAENHPKQITVGSIGNDVRFVAPYLRAPLVVWDAAAIDGIESDDQRELSCGYRYDADMTPGIYKGTRYDGVMRNILGNHVTLVESGRAGSDVIVGDAAFIPNPPEIIVMAVRKPAVAMSRKALLASGALLTYVRPKLATDQQIDIAPILKGVTAKTWKTDKPRIVIALDAALKGKLAEDATIADLGDVLEQLDAIVDGGGEDMPQAGVAAVDPVDPVDPGAEDDDAGMADKVSQFLTGKISDEDLAALMAMLTPAAPAATEDDPTGIDAELDADETDPKKKPPFPLKKKDAAVDKGLMTKTAMDAALKTVEQATIKRMNAIREAERIVRPWIGEVAMGQDSAEAVYKLALDSADIDLTDVPPIAYRAVLQALPQPNATVPQPTAARMALDSAGAKKYAERFPHANRLQTN